MSAADRARVVETGRSTASSSRSHSSAAGVAKTLPAPLITAGTPARSSASSTSAASLFVGTSTATWRGRTGSRRRSEPSAARDDQRRGRRQDADDVGRQVVRDQRPPPPASTRIPSVSAGRARRRGAGSRTRSGAVDGRVDQPRLAVRVGRADGPVDDALVAELGAVEERVERVDQPLVAAPVRRQRRLW